MDKLFTLITFPPSKTPELTLQARPFADCRTVGMNFLERTVTELFGNREGNGFVTYEEDQKDVVNELHGRTFKVWTAKAMFYGIAPVVTVIATED